MGKKRFRSKTHNKQVNKWKPGKTVEITQVIFWNKTLGGEHCVWKETVSGINFPTVTQKMPQSQGKSGWKNIPHLGSTSGKMQWIPLKKPNCEQHISTISTCCLSNLNTKRQSPVSQRLASAVTFSHMTFWLVIAEKTQEWVITPIITLSHLSVPCHANQA